LQGLLAYLLMGSQFTQAEYLHARLYEETDLHAASQFMTNATPSIPLWQLGRDTWAGDPSLPRPIPKTHLLPETISNYLVNPSIIFLEDILETS
jgi:hypothetical protein